MVSPEDLSMYTIPRHVGHAMHEANDLVPPPTHPWPFRQFPEIDGRGDTSLVAAKLREEGYLDISHLLDGEVFENVRGVPICCQLSRAAMCVCLAIGVRRLYYFGGLGDERHMLLEVPGHDCQYAAKSHPV